MVESDKDRQPVSRGLLKRFSADLGKAIAANVQAPLNSRIGELEKRIATLEEKLAERQQLRLFKTGTND